MKLEDTYEDQPVALVIPFGSMPKGSIGFLKGYSQTNQRALVEWEPGSFQVSSYIPLSALVGICQ